MKTVGTICTLFLFLSPAFAEDRYVTDQIDIYVRSGPTTAYKLVDSVSTGEPVKLLESNEETGFSKIQDRGGKSFWIETQHLTTEAPARSQLSTLRKKLDEQAKKHKQELSRLKAKVAENKRLSEQNQKLASQLSALDKEVEGLKHFKEQSDARFQKEVFFAGGGVMAIGLIFGFIFSKLGGKKRRRDLF